MMVFTVLVMGWWGDSMAGGLSPLWGLGMVPVWLVVLFGIGCLLYRGLVEEWGRVLCPIRR